MSLWDPETEQCDTPSNLLLPPRSTDPRKGHSRLWDDYKFPELGIPPDILKVAASKNIEGNAAFAGDPADTSIECRHPFMTEEQASHVDKWVSHGVESGAVGTGVSEPNTALPLRPSTDQAADLKEVVGIKKRRVAIRPDAPRPAPTAPVPVDAVKQSGPKLEKSNLVDNALIEITDTATGPSSAPKGQDQKHESQSELPMSRKSDNRQPLQLIDASDDDALVCSPRDNESLTTKSPLIPLNAQPGIGSGNRATIHRKSASSASENRVDPAIKNKIAASKSMRDIEEAYSLGLRDFKASVRDKKSSHKPKKDNPMKDRPEKSQEKKESDLLAEEQKDPELSSRAFHKTMGQKAGKSLKSSSSKASGAKRRQAILAEAWGFTPPLPSSRPPSVNIPNFKALEAPKPSSWKKAQLQIANEARAKTLKDSVSSLHEIFQPARSFPGDLSVDVQLGLILIRSVPRNVLDCEMDSKAWYQMFRPEHNLRPQSTVFLDRLTTSGADVDFILDLTEDDKETGRCHRMFSSENKIDGVWYEFYCRTKNDDAIVIRVKDSGEAFVSRPEATLGTVNVHCPGKIWDMSAGVKGSAEYIEGLDSEIDDAILDMIRNIHVSPNNSWVNIYTKLPPNGQLRITKILMKRSSRHRYIGKETIAPNGTATTAIFPESSQSQPHSPIGTASDTKESKKDDKPDSAMASPEINRPTEKQGPYLQIKEVQVLLVNHESTDKTLISGRALDSDIMVDNHRLWYEVSIVDPEFEFLISSQQRLGVTGSPFDLVSTQDGEQQFPGLTANIQSNGSAALGSKVKEARPQGTNFNFTGESLRSNTVASKQPVSSTTSPFSSSTNSPTVEPSSSQDHRNHKRTASDILHSMFDVADILVSKVDGIGYHNLGPVPELAEDIMAGVTSLAPSRFAVGSSGSGYGRGDGGAMSATGAKGGRGGGPNSSAGTVGVERPGPGRGGASVVGLESVQEMDSISVRAANANTNNTNAGPSIAKITAEEYW